MITCRDNGKPCETVLSPGYCRVTHQPLCSSCKLCFWLSPHHANRAPTWSLCIGCVFSSVQNALPLSHLIQAAAPRWPSQRAFPLTCLTTAVAPHLLLFPTPTFAFLSDVCHHGILNCFNIYLLDLCLTSVKCRPCKDRASAVMATCLQQLDWSRP